jgi:hypothetical protein
VSELEKESTVIKAPVSVRVSVTITVDREAWADEYQLDDATAATVREDVRRYITESVAQLPGIVDTAAVTS